jgi:hypothetical protein
MNELVRLFARFQIWCSYRAERVMRYGRRRQYLQPFGDLEQLSHGYCFFVHDQMVDILRDIETRNIVSVTINFTDPRHADVISTLKDESLTNWLDENGYRADVDELIFRKTAVALMSDFCHFMFEALDSAARGKLTVSYALLRKPLKDNLYYLEWMLADRAGFLYEYRKNTSSMDVQKASIEKRLSLITAALGRTLTREWIDPGFLYELRYDKSVPWGFEHAWQQATHLVTTHPTFATSEMNLNFIFSTDEDRETQTRFMYSFLPPIMYYALEVMGGVVSAFSIPVDLDNVSQARRVSGLALCIERCTADVQEILTGGIAAIVAGIFLRCPGCGPVEAVGHKHLMEVYVHGATSCPSCGRLIRLESGALGH